MHKDQEKCVLGEPRNHPWASMCTMGRVLGKKQCSLIPLLICCKISANTRAWLTGEVLSAIDYGKLFSTHQPHQPDTPPSIHSVIVIVHDRPTPNPCPPGIGTYPGLTREAFRDPTTLARA